VALSLLVRDQDAEPVRVLADGIRVECLANGTAVTMRKNLATHREYGRAAYPTGGGEANQPAGDRPARSSVRPRCHRSSTGRV